MSNDTDDEAILALADRSVKGVKAEEDLAAFSQNVLNLTVQSALSSKMEEHLVCARSDAKGRGSSNRNDSTPKTLISKHAARYRLKPRVTETVL